MKRSLPSLLLVAAIVCLALAGWEYSRSREPLPSLSFEQTEYEFPVPVAIGQPQTFSFTALNRGNRIVKVVGLSTC